MNYNEALTYIHHRKAHSAKPGLHRIKALLEQLGNPQKGLPFLHVAGTNGKGSTATMLANVLRHAGYKTGLFTSPFIYDFRERFAVNGELIPRETLAELANQVAVAEQALPEPLTEFEVVTAIGFLYFRRAACDVVVLEVGLGGRFDATNVIEQPLASVICTVSLDHTEYLGDTVEKVAFEKAGIIKEGCPVILYNNNPQQAVEVIRQQCRERNAPLSIGGQPVSLTSDIDGNRFLYEDKEYTLSLRGPHQINNAVTVLETLKVLPFSIPDDAIRKGLHNAGISARLECICTEPYIFVDGGHNKEGIDCLIQAMDTMDELKNPTVIFAMMKDKPYQYAVQHLGLRARAFIAVEPALPRAVKAYDLKNMAELFCEDCTACENYNEAAAVAKEKGGPILVAGSLYMAGEMASELKKLFS